jgi:hypothetical protein
LQRIISAAALVDTLQQLLLRCMLCLLAQQLLLPADAP